MITRALTLAAAAGLASAVLLVGGTAVINSIGPASASQVPALVASRAGSASASGILTADNQNLDRTHEGVAIPEPGKALSASTLVSGPASTVSRTLPTATARWVTEPSATASRIQPAASSPRVSNAASAALHTESALRAVAQPAPAAMVTIAQLLADPARYHGRVVTSSGRVTPLAGDRFLINDGTGQIVVDLDDDLKITLAAGSIVTVIGEFEDTDHSSVFEIETDTVRDASGAQIALCADDDETDDIDEVDDDAGEVDDSDDDSGDNDSDEDDNDDDGRDDDSDEDDSDEDDSDDDDGGDDD